ncbi:YitT family protein [uncultured Rikenella sp.]|uniref:YitT family protein n=2 Tax=uncultured Rikenella sp. TaxID=368003 RepID=UPI0026275E56|nr:YitT family protein [uncultured Rikenella sp.]
MEIHYICIIHSILFGGVSMNTQQQIRQWAYVVVGSILIATAYVLFITPYRIVPGGVYGMGVVLNYLFPKIQVGTYGLSMDIPLLLIGFRLFGARFGAKTVVAALLTPVIMDGMTWMIGSDPATMLGGKIDLAGDVLLSCLFGGTLLGAGVGLILKTHATSGGTDIIAMIASRYLHMPISRAVLYVDSLVVLFGLAVLGDWRLPLYSLVTIFVSSRVIDYIVDGGSGDKLLFILSERHVEIRDFILDGLERGGTYIKACGMYTGADKEMIFVVVSRREVSLIRDRIRQVDPEAFMIVVDAHETLGEGFKTFEKP